MKKIIFLCLIFSSCHKKAQTTGTLTDTRVKIGNKRWLAKTSIMVPGLIQSVSGFESGT